MFKKRNIPRIRVYAYEVYICTWYVKYQVYLPFDMSLNKIYFIPSITFFSWRVRMLLKCVVKHPFAGGRGRGAKLFVKVK